MSVSDSSYWPTATVCGNHNRVGASDQAGDGLSTAAKKWSTPDASVTNDSETPESFLLRQERELAKGQYGNGEGALLAMAVKLWSTPLTHNTRKKGAGLNARRLTTRNTVNDLPSKAEQWATPTAADAERGTGIYPRGNTTLKGDAMNWADDAMNWATPRATDAEKGGPRNVGDPTACVATNSLLGRQAPRITKDGLLSLLPDGWTSSPLFLNPRFVEWLMGWPENWLCPELHGLTSSAPEGMESWLSRQRQLLSGWLVRQEWREVAA